MSVAITILSQRPLKPWILAPVLQTLKTTPLSLRWLDERVCDLEVDLPLKEARSRLALLPQTPLDIIAQPSHGRRKKMLVADMESTLVENEFLDELAVYCGVQEQMRHITDQAMNGLMDFTQAFSQRVGLLKGQPITLFERVWNEKTRFSRGAFSLVETMRRQGAVTILVSGGLRWFADRVSHSLGIDKYYSNDVEIRDGYLTGYPIPPVLNKRDKKRILLENAAQYGIPVEAVAAVGDGDNDLPMLLQAGLGCAYHAKEKVRQLVPYRVNQTDLTALLYAQGYSTQEFTPSTPE